MNDRKDLSRVHELAIRTPTDLVNALVEEFLRNADAGEHTRNDALVAQLTSWRDRQYEEAWTSWEASGEADSWDATSTDGLES